MSIFDEQEQDERDNPNRSLSQKVLTYLILVFAFGIFMASYTAYKNVSATQKDYNNYFVDKISEIKTCHEGCIFREVNITEYESCLSWCDDTTMRVYDLDYARAKKVLCKYKLQNGDPNARWYC